jgi:hypothetical protein
MLVAAAIWLVAPSAHGGSTFSGTVIAADSAGRNTVGAPGLTVTLTPPTQLKKQKQVTVTNEEGRFTIGDVDDGKYLLEVSQRLKVLYREVIIVPQTLQKEIRLTPDLSGLISQIDSDDAKTRLKPVNTLAFDDHYSTDDVVEAVLDRLEGEATKPLSAQGEINCLVILARRARDPWKPEHLSRTRAALATFQARPELTEAQRWAANELIKALAGVHETP